MVAFGVVVALVISLGWSAAAVKFGPALGFVDRPDDPTLKVHRRAAVPLGGIGILLAMWTGWAIAGYLEPQVMAPATAVAVLGLVDDRIGLSARVRLATQILIGVTTVAIGAVPLDSGRILELVAGVVLIVVAINAVNLFDGLDGLAGSVGLISALGIGVLAVSRGADPELGWILASSLAGFLVLNRHPARVFLGDNGAYLLGFLLAVGLMRASPTGLGTEMTVAGLVLGVFLLDLGVTIVRRALRRQPLFMGDRSHLYDRLVDRGWPIGRVVIGAVVIQVGSVAVALLIEAATT